MDTEKYIKVSFIDGQSMAMEMCCDAQDMFTLILSLAHSNELTKKMMEFALEFKPPSDEFKVMALGSMLEDKMLVQMLDKYLEIVKNKKRAKVNEQLEQEIKDILNSNKNEK